MHSNNDGVGVVKEITRFPVKSLLGESLKKVTVNPRGLNRDRLFALKNDEGKFGSGKNSYRFKKMDGLFEFTAFYDENGLMIRMPDNSLYAADDSKIDAILSEFTGHDVTLAKEKEATHFDDGPISIITTSSINELSVARGHDVDVKRFRPNLYIETENDGFMENDWTDKRIQIGDEVILDVVAPLERCVMVNFAQGDLKEDNKILKTVGRSNNAILGIFANVVQPGEIIAGDSVKLINK